MGDNYLELRLNELQAGQESLTQKVDDIHDALVGDDYHPNGLVTKVLRLEKDWLTTKAIAIGIAIISGGGTAFGVIKWVG